MTIWRWGGWLWLLALPLLSAARVPVWSSDLSLWQDAHRKATSKARPLVNIGNVFAADGDLGIAAQFYEDAAAVAQHPSRAAHERRTGWAVAMTNLAVVQAQLGRRDEAIASIRSVRDRFPEFKAAAQIAEQIDR